MPIAAGFLFEPRPRYAFYGASPELLASTRGRQLETMALAGSAARGETEDADRRLGMGLLASAKEREEHAIVVEKMRDRLAPVTESLADWQYPTLLKLSNIQHINTAISGILKQPSGISALGRRRCTRRRRWAVIRGLRRLRLIRELEPIPRGWYGAPVGWLGSQLGRRSSRSRFARRWRRKRAPGFTPAPASSRIVSRGSEWAETELKFRPMLDAHGNVK